jgi:hypothetical protein
MVAASKEGSSADAAVKETGADGAGADWASAPSETSAAIHATVQPKRRFNAALGICNPRKRLYTRSSELPFVTRNTDSYKDRRQHEQIHSSKDEIYNSRFVFAEKLALQLLFLRGLAKQQLPFGVANKPARRSKPACGHAGNVQQSVPSNAD